MRPIFIPRALAAAAVAAVALSQTTGAAAALTLNGALVANGVAVIPTPAQVTLTSVGNISGVNFTILGTDYRGMVVSEVLAGPNNNTVTSVNTYASVTSVTSSAAVATGTSVGNAATGASPVVPIDSYANPSDVSIGLDFVGAANVTVQYTLDDVFQPGVSLDSLVWYSHTQLTAIAANNAGTIISSVAAVRMITNSGTGKVTMIVRQSGGTGGA